MQDHSPFSASLPGPCVSESMVCQKACSVNRKIGLHSDVIYVLRRIRANSVQANGQVFLQLHAQHSWWASQPFPGRPVGPDGVGGGSLNPPSPRPPSPSPCPQATVLFSSWLRSQNSKRLSSCLWRSKACCWCVIQVGCDLTLIQIKTTTTMVMVL